VLTLPTDRPWSFFETVLDVSRKKRPGDARFPTLWPSEAGVEITAADNQKESLGACRRKVFFRYLQAVVAWDPDKGKGWENLLASLKENYKDVDDYMRFIWAQGQLYEDYLGEQAKLAGLYRSDQAPVYIRSHNVSGKRDIEVLNPETGKQVILEIKSVYGYGGTFTLGTDSARAKGQLGKPRDSNLMQIALYHWWAASCDDNYEESRLLYGARDNGRFAEYQVKTELDEESDLNRIYYRGVFPNTTAWVEADFTIEDILSNYEHVLDCVQDKVVPVRDFDMSYSEEQMQRLYDLGKLGKTDATKYEKIQLRKKFNEWVLTIKDLDDDSLLDQLKNWFAELTPTLQKLAKKAKLSEDEAKTALKKARALNKKKELKPLEKGDFACNYCSYQWHCYKRDGTPKDSIGYSQ